MAEGFDVLGADLLEARTGVDRDIALALVGRGRGVWRVRLVSAVAGLFTILVVSVAGVGASWLLLVWMSESMPGGSMLVAGFGLAALASVTAFILMQLIGDALERAVWRLTLGEDLRARRCLGCGHDLGPTPDPPAETGAAFMECPECGLRQPVMTGGRA